MRTGCTPLRGEVVIRARARDARGRALGAVVFTLLASTLLTAHGDWSFAQPARAARAGAAGANGEDPASAAATLDPSASPEEHFESANAAFAAGRYEEAIEGFESLAARHGYSPSLLFDLGNSYLRSGRIGPAVLAYERALVLDPRDADVRANLRQARQAGDLPEPEPSAWERSADLLSSTGWAYLLSAGLYVACLALALLRLVRSPEPGRSPVRRALLAAAAVGAVLTLGAGAFLGTRLARLDRGIVLAEQPTLRVAPYESATVAADLSPGEIVEIEREHNGFALIRTAKGRAGWTTPGSVDRIVPVDGVPAAPEAQAPRGGSGESDGAVRADARPEEKR